MAWAALVTCSFAQKGSNRSRPCILAQVFAWVHCIFDRLFGPRTRADELRDVRARLAAQIKPGVANPAEERLALRLRELREELSARVGQVQACSQCVRPRSADWPGGQCCSGHTRNLFTEPELASLRLSGTTPARLKPPRADQAGCAFRGPKGCSLQIAHRPNLCVRYICGEMLSELGERGDIPAIAQLQEELRVQFERFVAMRNERLDASHFAELKDSLSNRVVHR